MLRRLAISLAATSALVLTATAPALADHGPEPDFVAPDIQGGQKFCENPGEYVEGIDDFDLVVDETFKYHPPKGEKPPHDWITTEFHKDEGEVKAIDLVVDDDVLAEGHSLYVAVKGGTDANVYLGPDLEHLTAPDGKGISYFIICKVRVDMEDEEDEGENGDDENGDDEESGDEGDEDKSTETPEPKTSKSPAPVPTAVPAGASGSGDTSMAPVGIAAAALMVMAGSAALLRRRFAHQS